MVINTNTYAISSANNLAQSQSMLGQSLARLSSGDKISQPSDDAAGLAVSEKMKAEQKRVEAAGNNVQNAISYVQTTDGFLSNMSNMLSRMSELTTMSKDVTKNSQDLALYDQEFQALKQQMQQTVGGSEYGVSGQPLGSFNGISLFGTAQGLTVTIGENGSQTMTLPGIDLRDPTTAIASLLSIASSITASSPGANQAVINAIQEISTVRAQLGASESRLNAVASQLTVQDQNISSSVSTIRDVDVATESTQYARYQILVQAGTSMLAQANQLPATVLKLLQ